MLVTRYAEYLRARGLPFVLVEPKGTRLALDLSWAALISPSDANAIAAKVSHLFLPSISKFRDPEISFNAFKSAKVFAWVVHPNDPFRGFFPFSGKTMDWAGYKGARWLARLIPGHFKLVEDMFARLIGGQALAVMDGATSRALRYFYADLSGHPILIPIPSEVSFIEANRRVPTGKISIGYLGRMDDFKYSAIAPFISTHLAALAKAQPIDLHVISEGDRLSDLREKCERHGINLNEYGFRPNRDAKEIIKSNTDLAVTMGTSALDIAGEGHPCIVIDPALCAGAAPQQKFRFVHEIQDFTLGEYRDFPNYKVGLHDFEEIMSHIDGETGRLGHFYVSKEHNPGRIFDLVTKSILNSTLTVGDIAPLIGDVDRSFRSVRFWQYWNRSKKYSATCPV